MSSRLLSIQHLPPTSPPSSSNTTDYRSSSPLPRRFARFVSNGYYLDDPIAITPCLDPFRPRTINRHRTHLDHALLILIMRARSSSRAASGSASLHYRGGRTALSYRPEEDARATNSTTSDPIHHTKRRGSGNEELSSAAWTPVSPGAQLSRSQDDEQDVVDASKSIPIPPLPHLPAPFAQALHDDEKGYATPSSSSVDPPSNRRQGLALAGETLDQRFFADPEPPEARAGSLDEGCDEGGAPSPPLIPPLPRRRVAVTPIFGPFYADPEPPEARVGYSSFHEAAHLEVTAERAIRRIPAIWTLSKMSGSKFRSLGPPPSN
ncbi:uncharacterized protein SCHCODRAFT_01088534 [Schizophyllum commune H4-8]|nr:uncharacterized protein SCHCODRAFT_01088534 [Schizophyllum commune H4-8]KAI5895661.1 hypothetical protein SCHCODRAFT_01088534 [Schizophyllum commune H4-8]